MISLSYSLSPLSFRVEKDAAPAWFVLNLYLAHVNFLFGIFVFDTIEIYIDSENHSC